MRTVDNLSLLIILAFFNQLSLDDGKYASNLQSIFVHHHLPFLNMIPIGPKCKKKRKESYQKRNKIEPLFLYKRVYPN